MAELQQARDVLSPEGELSGRLRIAAPLTFGPTHLAPVLAEFARRHPRLHVHAAYGDRFVDLVAEGFDAAVRVGFLPDSNLIARRIAPLSGRCVASPEYIKSRGLPHTPQELSEHECLMQGTETWRFVSEGASITVRPQGRFKADNGVALTAAALAGLGIAALPDFLIEAHIASGALQPLLADYPPPQGGIYVVRPPGEFAPRKVRALIDFLVEQFSDSPSPSPTRTSASAIRAGHRSARRGRAAG
jgi:DNA-binding transcriptional LysR family regulator